MMVVVDFNDGPTSEPDPPHSHPHEQVSYVVSGEINLFHGKQADTPWAGGYVYGTTESATLCAVIDQPCPVGR